MLLCVCLPAGGSGSDRNPELRTPSTPGAIKGAKDDEGPAVKKCVPGPKVIVSDLDVDLSRTLKSEKVTKENAVNEFLSECRTHIADNSTVKHIILGNRAAGILPLSPSPFPCVSIAATIMSFSLSRPGLHCVSIGVRLLPENA